MNNIDIIKDDLVTNFEHYKALAAPQKSYWDRLSQSNPKIKSNLEVNVRYLFLIDITNRLPVTPEDALIVLDEIKLQEFLK